MEGKEALEIISDNRQPQEAILAFTGPGDLLYLRTVDLFSQDEMMKASFLTMIRSKSQAQILHKNEAAANLQRQCKKLLQQATCFDQPKRRGIEEIAKIQQRALRHHTPERALHR